MLDLQARLAIQLTDLVVGFGDRRVIDRLSLDVPRGEIFGLVGASGGGKSVLLRAILGLVPKQQGKIEILGVDRDTASPQDLQELEQRWGVLYQQGALFSSLTAFQNVEFPMREYLDLSPRTMREIATAKLEMVGLEPEDGDKFPAALSGGMTKRVALARALALDPRIVFLDEPTSGLDPIAAGEFDALIRTLHRTLNITVFMITHDLESLRTVCDRIGALADGKIVAIGSMAAMLASEHPWVKTYFLGDRGRALLRGETPVT
jgi:phospholipid/cholesterol/gamma-HCH transport system ATP-binding protein